MHLEKRLDFPRIELATGLGDDFRSHHVERQRLAVGTVDPALSARFFRLLAGYVTGVGLAEIGSRALQPDATPIRLERFRDTRRFPRVSAVVPHLRVKNLEAIFQFGMDLIFGAMRRQSRRPRTRRRTPGVGVS